MIKGNTYVFCDIHGCYSQWLELLDEVDKIDLSVDRMIFLGDYIDRGPHSWEVVTHIKSLEEEYGRDHVVCLKGNHEDMCLHNYKMNKQNDRGLANAWHWNGAKETFESYKNNGFENVTQEHLDWMATLRVRFEDENYYYVHAGFHPDYELDDTEDYEFMWIRYDFIQSEKNWGKPVVFGHTASEGIPLIIDTKIGLDTGGVYGYKFTCMRMEDKKIWQVNGYVKELLADIESGEF